MYIFSLAVADLIVGAICDPFAFLYTYYGRWPIAGIWGKIVCVFYLICDLISCTASAFHLIFIGHERYVATSKPFKMYTRSKSTGKTIIKISMIWFIAFFAWLPMFIIYYDTIDSHNGICYIKPGPAFMLVQSFVVYYIPHITLFFFCACIIWTLYKSTQNRINTN